MLKFACRRRLEAERGAVVIMASVVVTAVIGATAFSVDLGQLVSAKRELQAVVDLASLDAMRALDDSSGEGAGLTVDEFASALARASAQRNDFDPAGPGNSLATEVGRLDADTGTFTATSDPALRNAVRVVATRTLDWAFVPGKKVLTATAVAMEEHTAGLAIGSFLARLDSHKSAVLNGLLGGLLGGAVNLDLVSYQGMAAGTVSLAELRSELGLTAGGVSGLLSTEVTLTALLQATADALTARSDAVSLAAVTPVSTLRAATDATLRLRLGDVIDVVSGSGSAALGAELNVLQLVQTVAQVTDGDHFVSATLPVNIPGVASTSLQLALIEPPRIAIGPARQDGTGEWVTRAVTGQVRLALRVDAVDLLKVLGVTGLVSLPLYIEAGTAAGALTDIRCETPVDATQVDVATDAQAVRAAVGTTTTTDLQDETTSVTLTAGTIAHIPLIVRVTGASDVTIAHSASNLTFTGPYNWSNTQTVGSTTLGLAPLLENGLDLTVTTLMLGVDALAVENDTLAILGPIFDQLDAALIDPLLSALGVSLGGGDVTVWDANCAGKRIAG